VATTTTATAQVVPNETYILMRRFSAKEEARRLTCAVLERGALPGRVIGLENHLNYIHRPAGALDLAEAFGLCALLNSELLDRYFRISNGNTQVSATEIRAMPLPLLELTRQIGAKVQTGTASEAAIAEVLGGENRRGEGHPSKPRNARSATQRARGVHAASPGEHRAK
jgi:adenine-specific DNA-methyltransferase